MKKLRRMLLLLAMALLLPVCAKAADNNSIAVLHTREGEGVSGVEFSIYAVDPSHKDAASAYTAVLEAKQEPLAVKETDTLGKLQFTGLKDGTYLLKGKAYSDGTSVSTFEMSLVTMPWKDGDTAYREVVLTPKFTLREETQEVKWRILIVWKDEENPRYRPDSVTVDIYRNGILVDTVVLTDEDNWQYTWTDDDPLAEYYVVETVPDHYELTPTREGNTFILTHTLKEPDPTEPTKPADKLPQTGQLWWPVPLLAMVGCCLLLTGWLRRKEQ